MAMKRIYLDHAATTPMDPRVQNAMEPFLVENFGNAGGLYREGRIAKEAMEGARTTVAKIIGARPEEIIFTSGGTEADNLAIFGVSRALGRGHIITTKFEHHAVLEPCQQLTKEGFEVTFLDVGESGVVNPEDVKKALRPETILVSIMYANNEIGTIQPIMEIGKIIKEFRSSHFPLLASHFPYFHTDACQAAGYLDINVNNLGVDLMTINGPKIYGPKGIGFLYRKLGVRMKPQILGGGQETRMRSGTEPVVLIAGLAKALEIVQAERVAESTRLTPLRDHFISELRKRVPDAVLNGHPTKRLPNNVNISIPGANGEEVVLRLDAAGISCSTGSACAAESSEPSHVILALGRSRELANGSLRLTMGRSTTKEDIDYVLEKLSDTIKTYARNKKT